VTTQTKSNSASPDAAAILRPWSMKCWRFDTQRRAAETERQKLQSDRNRISKEIGIAKKNGQDTSAIEAEVRGIGRRIDEIGREADASDAKQRDLLLSIPNLPHEGLPGGQHAEENPEVRVWGAKPEFAFQPKDHTVLGAALGMLDFEAGVKITGSAFVVYRGAGARLERALISFLLDLHTTQHGYTEEISPPLLVKPECLEGTGQLPKFGDQVYHSPEDNLYLIPTAEVPVTNLHRDEIVLWRSCRSITPPTRPVSVVKLAAQASARAVSSACISSIRWNS
jgi:seryl-tRNA synthetase